MKRTNRNKIVISTLLATVLIGAGVVKTSQDSNIYVESFIEKETRADYAAYLVDDGAHKYYSMQNGMGAELLDQQIIENKGISDNWFEYKSGSASIMDPKLGLNSVQTGINAKMYMAANYQLTKLDEPTTIGGITTDKYYTIGLVFNNENDISTNKYTQAFTDRIHDGRGLDSANSKLTLMHKNDPDTSAEDITNAGFSISTSKYNEDAAHEESATYDSTKKTIYQEFSVEQKSTSDTWVANPSYEDWHSKFDNDETTLFGAKSYNPAAHLYINIPIVDNPLDEDKTDGFGLSPDAAAQPATPTTAYFTEAFSSKDVLAVSGFTLRKTGWVTDEDFVNQEVDYTVKFGTATISNNFVKAEDARWESAVKDHALNLSYPTPEFTITPMGYNDRNEFEVAVKYDHTAVENTFDIVEEIEYKMMGPERKDSDPGDDKVLWDEIIINDDGVTRNHRASIDDPTIVQDTYLFTDSDLPDEYQKWTDGNPDNGGQVDKDGNLVPGEAENIFADFVSLDGTTGYDGDMELDQVNSTIKYDGLFYGDDAEVGKDYEFSSQITLAPTMLGSESSFLTEFEGTHTTLEGEKIIYTILPGYATPIINHFEITKPENLDEVDPAGTFTINYSGDSKSETEDLGVGLKPSYLNMLQVIAVEVDTEGNVIGEEIALTDIFAPQNYVEASGAFSGEITTNDDVALNPLSNYRISLRSYYGNKDMPVDPTTDLTTLVADYTLDGEYIIISTDDLGDKQINITNNTVVVNADNSVTMTFDYATSIPTGMESMGALEDFLDPEIASVEVVNHLGEANEEVIDTVDFAGFDTTITHEGIVVDVAADKFSPNKSYDLSIRVKTVEGSEATSPAVDGDEFVTPATGPFVPVVSMLAPINTVDTVGGVNTDFEFTLEQQTGDGIDLVETSASNISNISLVINDGEKDIVTEDSIAIPTDDKSTIVISDTTNVYNTVTEYDYTITVDYAGVDPVVKQGKISFELNGFSELEDEDVVMTDISSTMTSLYLETEIKDVEIAPGYDSFYVNKVEIVDAENKPVDAIINWYDEAGTIIEAPVDTEEGIEFTGKFSAQLFNIAAGTDLSTYQIHINTNSINESEDDPTPFETDYYFNIFELAETAGLLDATGNFINSDDIDKEFMDVEPIEVSNFVLNEELLTVDSASFELTFNDKFDVFKKDEIVLKDNKGTEYSLAAGNMEIKPVSTRAAGMKTYSFTLTGLSDNTDYSGFTMSYVISENFGTEEDPIVSSTNYVVDLTDVVFKTPEKPKDKSFPWWIIILLLLTLIGILILLVLLFLRSVRVVSTTETTKGSTTFVVNRDKQSGFLDTINGAKLEATQNGNTSNVEFKASVNADNKVAITLTGIINDAPIKGLKFIVDNSAVEASNAKVEAANKSLEDKFAKENEAYQAAVKTWEENKAKATEAGKEFTDAKPTAPAKPTLEKLAKPNKDVKVIGSVKTALEDSSNKEEPKKPATEEKPAAKKNTTATTAAKKPTESKTEEEKKSATGSAEIIY